MKRFTKGILSVLFCMLVFTGCSYFFGESSWDNGSEPTPPVQQNSPDVDLNFYVTTDTECPEGEIRDEFLHEDLTFHSGDVVYLVADLTVRRFRADVEEFRVEFDLSSLRDFNITLDEAKTGIYEQSAEKDHLLVNLTYGVPEDGAERDYRIVFRVGVKAPGDYLRAHAFLEDFENNSFDYEAGFDYTFALNQDSTYTLVSTNCPEDRELAIPAVYRGLPVTKIGNRAFFGYQKLENLILPDGIAEIEESAFENSALTNLDIPASLTSVGKDAFSGCRLQSVNINDLAAWCAVVFGNIEANPLHCSEHLYVNGAVVTELAFPGAVTRVGPYAFYGCSELQTLDMGYVQTVGAEAFYGCTALETVDVRRAFDSVGRDAFAECPVSTVIVHKNFSYVDDLRTVFPQVQLVKCDLSDADRVLGIPTGIFAGLTYCLFGSADGIEITAARASEARILLQNASLSGTMPLDLTNVEQAYLLFEGTNTVSSDAVSYPALNAKGVTFEGDATSFLTFFGADGGDGTEGSVGTDGGDAAVAETVTVSAGTVSFVGGTGGYGSDGTRREESAKGGNGGTGLRLSKALVVGMGATLKVTGGDGGTGGNGAAGNRGGTSIVGEDGRVGGIGGDGGLAAILSPGTEIFVLGDALLCGGNGGNGGAGGNGGRGGDGKTLVNIITGGKDGNKNYGARGGNGGSGGNGGAPGSALSLDGVTLQDPAGTLVNQRGKYGCGGNGGNGGDGGTGGNYYNSVGTVWQCSGGSGGNGGKGGDGSVAGKHGNGGFAGVKGNGKPVNGIGLGINYGVTYSDDAHPTAGNDGEDGQVLN